MMVFLSHIVKCNNYVWNVLLCTSISYKSEAVISEFIPTPIHFEHLPVPTFLGCAAGRTFLAHVLSECAALSLEYFTSNGSSEADNGKRQCVPLDQIGKSTASMCT